MNPCKVCGICVHTMSSKETEEGLWCLIKAHFVYRYDEPCNKFKELTY